MTAGDLEDAVLRFQVLYLRAQGGTLLPTMAVFTAFERHGSTTRDEGNYDNHIKPHVELPSAQAEFDCRTVGEANALSGYFQIICDCDEGRNL